MHTQNFASIEHTGNSTMKPLADGNASQSNPRFMMELLSRNGKIKAFIGAVAVFSCRSHVCFKVEPTKSHWIADGKVTIEKLNLSEFLFKDIGSQEFFKPKTLKEVEILIASISGDAIKSENKPEEQTTMEGDMKKKTGKIALAKELLKAGKTPAQVTARLVQSFKVEAATAKNTVAWCKSMLKKESAAE